MPHPVRRVHKNSLVPVPFDTIHVPKAMVRKTHKLCDVRLSPQLSPLFPCTSCGKPVLTYRRRQALSVVIPGCPSFHSRAPADFRDRPISHARPCLGKAAATRAGISNLPRCPVSAPTENVTLVPEMARIAKRF